MQNSLAKNAIYKAILNVFNLLVPLLVGPYVTGLLNEELYGMYNRVLAEFQVFLTIGAFGIYNYGVREISKVREDINKVSQLFTSLFTAGVISNFLVTIFYVIYFLTAGRLKGEYDLYVYLIMIVQIVGNIVYVEFINEAVENYSFITKKTILVRLAYLVSIFVFVREAEDIIPYTLVVCLTVFINNFISFAYIKRRVPFCESRDIRIMRHLIPLVVSLMMTNVEILYTQLDKLWLGAINDVWVTEYVLPYTLVGMISSVPLALVTVSIPRLSTYVGNRDYGGYFEVLNSTTNLYMSMVIPMAMGVSVLAQEIMQLYTRGVYTYVYPVLMVAALARIVYAYQTVISNLVMYVNSMERMLVALLAAFGVCNVIFKVVLNATGTLNPTTATVTTALATLLFVVAAYAYTCYRFQRRYTLLSKRIFGYLAVSLLFFPISGFVRSRWEGLLPVTVWTIVGSVAVYGIYLLITRDPILSFLFRRGSQHDDV